MKPANTGLGHGGALCVSSAFRDIPLMAVCRWRTGIGVEGEVGGCNSALLGVHAASVLTGDGSSVDRAAS